MLEKTQELIKEEGKDDIELRDFAARFDRLDTTVQLQQGAGSLEIAKFKSRAVVETKDGEVAKRCKPDVWNFDKTHQDTTCGKILPE